MYTFMTYTYTNTNTNTCTYMLQFQDRLYAAAHDLQTGSGMPRRPSLDLHVHGDRPGPSRLSWGIPETEAWQGEVLWVELLWNHPGRLPIDSTGVGIPRSQDETQLESRP